jgi:hypothetical protein
VPELFVQLNGRMVVRPVLGVRIILRLTSPKARISKRSDVGILAAAAAHILPSSIIYHILGQPASQRSVYPLPV